MNIVQRWLDRAARIDVTTINRLVSLPLFLGTRVVIGLSLWLEPASQGHATHLQLGLHPCSFLTWTGYACPMCGATTSFALMAHLRPIAAFLNQPFASFLFLSTASVFGVSFAELVQPRLRWSRLIDWLEPIEGRVAAAFLLFMAVAWVYKISLMKAWIALP